VLLLVEVIHPRLEGEGLGPQEGLLATSAVHVVAATILLNLNIAQWAEADKIGVLHRPSLVELVVLLLALATLLLKDAKSKLLLSAIGVHTKAILLSEVAALEWARSQDTLDLELSEGLIKGKAIELIPSELINELLDLPIIDNLAASEVRALDTNDLNEVNDDGNAIS
jgi:hypothetical protein